MIDSHAHVASSQFDNDRVLLIKQAKVDNIRWLEIGTRIQTSINAIKLATKYDNVIIGATVGVHPNHVHELTKSDWEKINDMARNKTVVAIGEIGLDYFHSGSLNEQLPALQKFHLLAYSANLPIVYHVRSSENHDAHKDLIKFLMSLPPKKRVSGVSHTFSGTLDQAKRYIKLGLYIGISGIITFKNAGHLVEVVQKIPLDKLLIETDCPYLAPEPYRGQRNQPAYVKFIAEKIADLKQVTPEEVLAQTDMNCLTLFSKK